MKNADRIIIAILCLFTIILSGSPSNADERSLNFIDITPWAINLSAVSIAIDGNYAYLAQFDDGVKVLDISNPAQLKFVASIKTQGCAMDLLVYDGYLFIGDNGLSIYRIDDDFRYPLVNRFDTPNAIRALRHNGKYVLGYARGEIYLFDASDISNVHQTASIPWKG